MYELDEFKRLVPKNPMVWAVPLLIFSIVLFVLATINTATQFVVLPWSEDEIMIVTSIVFFVGLMTSILVISSFTQKRYRMMVNTVIPALVDRVNLETRHQLVAQQLTGKEKPVISLRGIYSYSSALVQLHLVSSEFPRIEVQKLQLTQSNGKSSSTTFDGYAIYLPVRTQKFMMASASKNLYGFGRKDGIPTNDPTIKAFGAPELCSNEVVRWLSDLIASGKYKRPLIAVSEGMLVLAIGLPVKKFTTLSKVNEAEYDLLFQEVRTLLHDLDELIEGMHKLPIA